MKITNQRLNPSTAKSQTRPNLHTEQAETERKKSKNKTSFGTSNTPQNGTKTLITNKNKQIKTQSKVNHRISPITCVCVCTHAHTPKSLERRPE